MWSCELIGSTVFDDVTAVSFSLVIGPSSKELACLRHRIGSFGPWPPTAIIDDIALSSDLPDVPWLYRNAYPARSEFIDLDRHRFALCRSYIDHIIGFLAPYRLGQLCFSVGTTRYLSHLSTEMAYRSIKCGFSTGLVPFVNPIAYILGPIELGYGSHWGTV